MGMGKEKKGKKGERYPFCRIEIQILNLAVIKKAGEADSVVCQVRLLANDDNVVFPRPSIKF